MAERLKSKRKDVAKVPVRPSGRLNFKIVTEGRSDQTEAGAAFLVDSAGQKTLSDSEQKTIRQYLDAPDGPVREAVEWLLDRATEKRGLDDEEVLGQMLWHYTNTFDHSLTEGVLASIHGTGEIEDLTKEETEILQDTLTAIRVGGWFPEWLRLQVSAIAGGEGIPGDRH